MALGSHVRSIDFIWTLDNEYMPVYIGKVMIMFKYTFILSSKGYI